MLELIADKELCKGCACVVKMPCFATQAAKGSILVSKVRFEEEEVRAAVLAVIAACPLKAIELKGYSGELRG
jgi:ferredoxin